MNARFALLAAVVMKMSIFFDITTCTQLKVNRRFGGTYLPSLQRRRISQETDMKQIVSISLLFDPKVGDNMLLRNAS
jgi:hypothetical protein